MDIELTGDQKKASDAIIEFVHNPRAGNFGHPLLTLGGYAGTGKTTTVAETIKILKSMGWDRPIAYCAFAGKAASVLKSKLDAHRLLNEMDYCGTIHSLIYTPFSRTPQAPGPQITHEDLSEVALPRQPITERSRMDIGFNIVEKSSLNHFGLIVVDEASMLNQQVFEDLTQFNIPILAVGDHGQLPPVGDKFSLMEHCDIKLEKIHRQAEGDPIIQVSIMAREYGKIKVGAYGDNVEKIRMAGSLAWADKIKFDTMMLCGTNNTRVWWNNFLRSRYGFASEDPMKGERVICLKNNREFEIYNGMTGVIDTIGPNGEHWYHAAIRMDANFLYDGHFVFKHQFGSTYPIYKFNVPSGAEMPGWMIGDLFDWAYCMTVHKAQGSEADDVVVIEERLRGTQEDWCRWLYTAVTRAKKRLLIVGS